MKLFLALLALVTLVGCAQWNQMTPKERKIVWGAAAASVIAGYAARDDDDVTNITNITNVTNVYEECRHKCPNR